jgi:DNA-binding response OmpR family regulator
MDRGLAGARVLVVEDEFVIAAEVEQILSRHGCVVLGPSAKVATALDIVRANPPDLVVTNLNLRGCMAHPLLRELAERGIPYIIITGDAAAFSHTEGALILHRPTDDTALIGALREVMGVG